MSDITDQNNLSCQCETMNESNVLRFQAAEYLLFAGLMVIATIVFALLASRYQYVDEKEFYETEGQPLAASNNRAETSG